MNRDRGSLIDRLVATAVALCVAAAALTLAVHLIESVWLPLIVIVGGGVLLSTAVHFLRARRDDW